MEKEDICFMPAYEMAEKIKTQELTSQEITEILIERIEQVNPLTNAYCTTTFEVARSMAKLADEKVKKGEKLGLLNGIPTSVKDLMQTKGIRTTYGSKLHENFIPEQDDIAVQRLKKAGCVLMGKTNTPDFGHIALANNLIFGQTKNPWDIEKNSGGSSGGAASAVASGLGPLALGSDGGGSIRVPSCLCGVYGLKPTFGRIPRYPTMGIAFWTMDHYGPITRNVKDAALMLDVLKGNHPSDSNSFPYVGINYIDKIEEKPPKLKIGISTTLGYFKSLEDEIEKSVLDNAQKFEQFDWKIENSKIKLKKTERAFGMLVASGYASDLKKDFDKQPEDFSPDLASIINYGSSLSAMDLGRAKAVRKEVYQVFDQYFKEYDILITPTTPTYAFKIEMGERGTIFPLVKGKSLNISSWMSYTYPYNMSGLPAASIPCGWTTEGLPIGMQIIGRRFDEKTVLQVSRAFEEIAPWQDKRPKFD
ncbi:MAG: amidase [Promethearchaeota archaeon]|jgi:Asp-tRNA(Asn)/Glu-tRNA(Gln) amidotransferase A subunit family amidase